MSHRHVYRGTVIDGIERCRCGDVRRTAPTVDPVQQAEGLALGQQARDQGIARTESANAAWVAWVARLMKHDYRIGQYVTGDELWQTVTRHDVGEPTDRRASAAVWRRLVADRWCQPLDGHRRLSARPEHHAYPMKVYVVVGQAA